MCGPTSPVDLGYSQVKGRTNNNKPCMCGPPPECPEIITKVKKGSAVSKN